MTELYQGPLSNIEHTSSGNVFITATVTHSNGYHIPRHSHNALNLSLLSYKSGRSRSHNPIDSPRSQLPPIDRNHTLPILQINGIHEDQ